MRATSKAAWHKGTHGNRGPLRSSRDQPGLDKVRLERFHEGLSVQIMHIGPYSEERTSIERMHAFARENGYALLGKHREIYVGDPRRTKPERRAWCCASL